MAVAGTAVAVSVTWLTDVAEEATGTWTWRATGCLAGTGIVHSTGGDLAAGVQTAPSWLVSAGVMLAEFVPSSTVRVSLSPGVQFLLDSCTVNVPVWPRWMPFAGWVTLMQSSGAGAGLDEAGLGDELAADVTKNALSVAVVVDEGDRAGFVVLGCAEVGCTELGWALLGWAVLGWAVLGLAFAEPELAECESGVAEVLGVADCAVAGDCAVADCAVAPEGGAWLADTDDAGVVGGAGVVGVWVGVPGEEAATGTQLLLVAGRAARVIGAALAMPWVPSASRTPPLTTPAAIARVCTNHMKDCPVCPACQVNRAYSDAGTTRSRWIRYP